MSFPAEPKSSMFSDRMLHMLVDNAPDIVLCYDRNCRLIYANAQFEVALGASLGDVFRKTPKEIVSDGRNDVYEAAIKRVIFSGKDGESYLTVLDSFGEKTHHQMRMTPELDDSGKVITVFVIGRDITERLRAEEALRSKEQELRALAESSPGMMGAFYARPDGSVCMPYVSPNIEKLFGLRPQDVVNDASPLMALNHPDDAQRVRDTIAESARNMTTWHEEYRIMHPALGERWMESNTHPLPHPDGGVVWYGHVHDITARKQAEALRASSERQYRTLAENYPDAIFRYDRDYRGTYVNQKICQIFGASSEELLGSLPAEGVTRNSTQSKMMMDCIARVFDSGASESFMVGFFEQDGEFKDYHMLLVPEHDAAGRVESVLGFARNVTEIRSLERRQSQYFALAPGLLATILKRADGSYAMPFVSEGVRELYGIEPEDVMRDLGVFAALAHPDDAAMTFRKADESARDLTPYRVEYRINHPSKGLRWIECNSTPQRLPDGGTRWDGFYHDITERKRLEYELTSARNFLGTILDNVACSIFVKDRKHRFVLLNNECCKLNGYSREAMLGKTDYDFFGKEQADEFWKIEEQVYISGETSLREDSVIGTDGEVVCRHTRKVRLITNDGIVLLVGINIDITERKRLEQALAEREHHFRSLAENSLDVIVRYDRELRRTYVNPAWEKANGMAAAEVLGKRPTEVAVIASASAREFEDKLRKVLESGEPEEIELIGNNRLDHLKYFSMRVVPEYGVNGEVVSLLTMANDITENKRMQDVLKEKFERIVELNNMLEVNARDLEEQAAEYEAQAVELATSQEQILQTEAWYHNIVRSSPDGMLVVDENGLISLVNRNIEKMFGYGEEELIGRPVELLVPADVRQGHVAKRDGFIAGGEKQRSMDAVNSEQRACRKDGREFPVYVSLSRLPDMDGRTGATCVALRDITERKRLQDALVARERESSTLIDNSPDTISRYNRECRRTFVNNAFASLAKGGAAALLGKTPSECPGGPSAAPYEAKIREVFETGIDSEFEFVWQNKDGREICSYMRITAERDAQGNVVSVLTVGRDITELSSHRKRVHQMAFYDALTALPNRALFNDRLHQMITDASWHGHRAGVMVLDLDRFKAVNDTLGHPTGDVLLREAAARLTRSVRTYDTVARLGGDEFAILLPEIRSGDDLGRVASKIVHAFKEPFLLEGKEVFVTTSIGIAVYPADSEDGDDLLKQADSAMYFAKRSGRNTFRFYSKDMTDLSNEKLLLESDLRRGFARAELELYYQPKVSLIDGMLIGSEALLRWNHPQRGMVPPDKFISIAEDSGLIVEIGEWVLRDACSVAHEWNGHGKPMHKVAINLSARQFQSNDLVRTVRKALKDTHCQPEWIELEITESLLMDEDSEVLETLNKFREMGITVAIDDFGTGYSSLSYLARFPIDTLKIDRSFTSKVTEGGHHSELVKAIISIAKSLNQKVVAEGVETVEQVEKLQAYGCHIAQGYLYSKPVPKTAFEELPRLFEAYVNGA